MQLETKDYIHFQAGDHIWEGSANKALPGDLVKYDGDVTLVKRAKHRLVGVLELASKVRYGITSHGHPMYRFTPWKESYPPFFVGCSSRDSSNVLAQVDFLTWDSTCPRGNLIRIIGKCGDLAAEEAALLIHADWRKGLVINAELVVPAAAPGSLKAFHIDPPGCKDVDDAISIVETGAGTEIHIHIADVASWLHLNPELMPALEGGQTLYKDGEAIRPMFPATLSEGLFSLLPGQERDVLSLVFTDSLTNPVWRRQRILITESYTYETAVKSPNAALLTKVTGSSDPHEWIEKLMLLYNRTAAQRLRELQKGILRRHSAPDMEKFKAYEARGFPAHLAFAAGEYCSVTAMDVKHWGLDAAAYCHATSPIRRAADCYNQMILMGYSVNWNVCQDLNAIAKRAKAYERDLAFVRVLLGWEGWNKEVDGIAGSGRVWIPAWGKLVKGSPLWSGPVRLSVFCDAEKRNWKRRMVLNLRV